MNNMYRVLNATACPATYLIKLDLIGFDGPHSGTYVLTVENRAGTIEHTFVQTLEGWFISNIYNRVKRSLSGIGIMPKGAQHLKASVYVSGKL